MKIKLRYSSGNILSPDVHKIGILAVGSPLENHGAALPIDTDSKIAAYLALQASIRTGAMFLGILYAGTEYDYVKHGVHMKVEDLVEGELKPTMRSAKRSLNLEKIVLVNGHGGNVPLKDYLGKLEAELGLEIVLNNRIVEIEGPHAGTGELSMGAALGFLDESRLDEHCDFKAYPEVGMVGLTEARKAEKGIDEGAKTVEKNGVHVDPDLGQKMLDDAVEAIIKDVEVLLAH